MRLEPSPRKWRQEEGYVTRKPIKVAAQTSLGTSSASMHNSSGAVSISYISGAQHRFSPASRRGEPCHGELGRQKQSTNLSSPPSPGPDEASTLTFSTPQLRGGGMCGSTPSPTSMPHTRELMRSRHQGRLNGRLSGRLSGRPSGRLSGHHSGPAVETFARSPQQVLQSHPLQISPLLQTHDPMPLARGAKTEPKSRNTKKRRVYANFFEKFTRTFAFVPVTRVRNATEIVQKNLFR